MVFVGDGVGDLVWSKVVWWLYGFCVKLYIFGKILRGGKLEKKYVYG